MDLNRKEIYRYLGYKGTAPDETVSAVVEDSIVELLRVMRPKFVSRPVTITRPSENIVLLDTIEVHSKSLYQHLDTCSEGVLLAATLGASVDMLIHRYNVMGMSRAVILQACAAAAIERVCDDHQGEIEEQAKAKGLFLRPRFSPGYGDFPISGQPEFLRLTGAEKKIGLTVTDTCILVPRKSVTAVCGIADHPVTGTLAGCATCALRETCKRRKEGIPCGTFDS